MPPLDNPKHEAFVQALFKGESASQAYVSAGYAKNDGNAVRLKGNEKVRARLTELQSARAEAAGVTVESLTTEFEKDRTLARKLGQASAAIKATQHIGVLHGVYVEKRENTNTNLTYHERLSDDELDAEYRRAIETDSRLAASRREAEKGRQERPARVH